ncbi:type II secretion system minor pseudopilin GspK [Pseudomonas syringae group genomosp. 3]|uniref:type II secretion system minor pseudopilin GspK n=1 Tax=Pseudomonas syringae group genomosp. 3 TaxID=251701 RepID=UPI00160546C1|nr:type II secretion system minor pseudopilin GspK [Pseudomonas syringae group genomosp. 3]
MAALNTTMRSGLVHAVSQGGSAIISALLIVAIVSVIAAGMVTRQGVLIRTLEAEQFRSQNSAVLSGGLEVSRMLLWDSRRKNRTTRLDQAWAQPIGPAVNEALSQSGGDFQGLLEDQQGKFNLRNLLLNRQLDIGQLRSFERLCQFISITDALCQRISQRVFASYLRFPSSATEAGRSSFESGREKSLVEGKTPTPASLPVLRSLDDLQGLPGLSDQMLERLKRYVCILPEKTWVNSNTASAEVLAAVVPGLSLPSAQILVAERDRGQWFSYRSEITARMRLSPQGAEELEVGIGSEWFLLQGQARRDGRLLSMEALLYRRDYKVPQVIWSRIGL